MKRDYFQESVNMHQKYGGKIEIQSKIEVNDRHDLSIAYSPGVAEPCREIAKNPQRVFDLTIKKNTVAIVSDGSAVLGLGNIGAHAAIPVMEGKALLFKKYANLDAFPICINTQHTDEIINIVKNISPVFGGINLEDIAAPKCFEIEESLQNLGIPVFHDDQHGTAIVTLAALINSCKIANKLISDLNIVVNGAGAAGKSIIELLTCHDYTTTKCVSVKNIIACDSKGIVSNYRADVRSNPVKNHISLITNKENRQGSLEDALADADVFIGVSKGKVLTEEMVKKMNPNPIIFALANPFPEIMPKLAKNAGALIVATGRSDFPNQVNNVLAFPGIFRGAIDARAKTITNDMKYAASESLADATENISVDNILPSALDENVCKIVAKNVEEAVE